MKKFHCLILTLTLALLSQPGFAGTLVQFHMYLGVATYMGDIEVELYDQDKPVTVKNFLHLVESGAYEQSFFHRLVPGFVLQGGGYNLLNPFSTNIMAPPFANIGQVLNFGNITNEFKVGTFHSNSNGTIAMAKTSDPNSANSQFFFNLADNSTSLDSTNNSGGFTVFGHVLRGTNVLAFFNTLRPGYGLVNLTNIYGASGVFNELPNSTIGTNAPPYDDLVLFTMDILSAQVKIQTNGTRQIIWNSISGLTNIVEFATNLPPSWQSLISTNGTGAELAVTDSSTNNTQRFYRVRILY